MSSFLSSLFKRKDNAESGAAASVEGGAGGNPVTLVLERLGVVSHPLCLSIDPTQKLLAVGGRHGVVRMCADR